MLRTGAVSSAPELVWSTTHMQSQGRAPIPVAQGRSASVMTIIVFSRLLAEGRCDSSSAEVDESGETRLNTKIETVHSLMLGCLPESGLQSRRSRVHTLQKKLPICYKWLQNLFSFLKNMTVWTFSTNAEKWGRQTVHFSSGGDVQHWTGSPTGLMPWTILWTGLIANTVKMGQSGSTPGLPEPSTFYDTLPTAWIDLVFIYFLHIPLKNSTCRSTTLSALLWMCQLKAIDSAAVSCLTMSSDEDHCPSIRIDMAVTIQVRKAFISIVGDYTWPV